MLIIQEVFCNQLLFVLHLSSPAQLAELNKCTLNLKIDVYFGQIDHKVYAQVSIFSLLRDQVLLKRDPEMNIMGGDQQM